ncbi:MAG: hypothetical protein A3B96_02435 [Candidatus Spechtbacteria bacterium RIFCSPHIGHO2_02_FULL_43_15b]|uniref:Uncharacterized protein n=1 Tax=Candidatus Spechtbacteria bacterium RIFCSPHIGHO2_01_FULL_43_30 TaxID=1802158 RepID=A0A1G2H6A8_9BACT|nr:MAG: hypothetical protein A2827_04020 [Candidatus Spechtbacteria bacterium RIFCSPHIGHO2_01_FULL_43_30]OGZ59884.1 MAG: hypothetical protein A3B96_02435 [Candidatus Spechtbacteria bacterium RIFCSPHIGHO2_02_FULL_43_15b]
MGTLELASLLSLSVSAVFFLLHLVKFSKGDSRDEFTNHIIFSLVPAVILFGLLLGINFFIFYFARPALVGPWNGWLIISLLNFIVGFILFLFHAVVIIGKPTLSVIAPPAVMALWFVVSLFVMVLTPISDNGAKTLAGYANVEYMEKGLYPETDADHIILVSEENARYIAGQIISESTSEDVILGTMYRPECCVLQSINGHAYWIAGLRFNGLRISNTVNRVVPGYIVIDAENPNSRAQVRLGYEMRYTPRNYFGNNLKRHIYTNGYRHWKIDDLTIEIDDNWKPWFSASLNKPALRFKGSVPKMMLLIDPETGKIHEHELDKIPEFVDRVYSQHVAYDFLDWWGRWDNAPWKIAFETPQNRTKPATDPTIVYTKGGHPSWQILMTSRSGGDKSTTSVILFEGRSNIARKYDISGIAKESDVLKAFTETKENITGLQPAHLSMHRIYGELTWVVTYITPTVYKQSQPFHAVGLLPAYNVQGANVVMKPNIQLALLAYRQMLAQGRGISSEDPQEGGLQKTAEGNVLQAVSFVINGETNYRIIIDSMPQKVFQGAVGDGENIELPFVEEGRYVRIIYLDIGKPVADVIVYDDLTMDIGDQSPAEISELTVPSQ